MCFPLIVTITAPNNGDKDLWTKCVYENTKMQSDAKMQGATLEFVTMRLVSTGTEMTSSDWCLG